MQQPIFFQPGWAMPIVVEHRASFFEWFLGLAPKACLARRQGRCPGLDQCHDCAWSSGQDE